MPDGQVDVEGALVDGGGQAGEALTDVEDTLEWEELADELGALSPVGYRWSEIWILRISSYFKGV